MHTHCSVLYKNGMLSAYDPNSSAPLFIIMPGPLSRFFIQGNVLMHDSKTQTPQEIYRASTHETAASLLQAIHEELQHRRAKINLAFFRFFVAPLIFFCLAFIGYQYAKRQTPPPPPTEVSRTEAPQVMPPVAALPPAAAPLAPASKESSNNALAIRAASLKKAADSGRYTINLSSGRTRTIYVFSDPLCPHCQEIEPTLEALTRDYNVVIFPVTLVGKQDTVAAVSPILCVAPDKRTSLWQSLFRADGNVSLSPTASKETAPDSCTDGQHAISINDRAFDYYQLPGTPQLIADDGRDIPFSALTSDDALANFMNAPIQGADNAIR
ncbi:hypothetical protein [Hafnia sp. HMSC23F03]|uniref:hypothetical protein n=1 Tax=Hafnia sp. HMSC23F03 TaxID=1581059 RepID=UPI0008A29563|nr:hypothetical protein [Hafnia sp. HMSC23F03]OFS08565.1 hypothetical protein HMPREF3091_18265 [Hafnia sp. HMSC23F03]